MKTFLLNPYGFCPGVEKAIKIACEQVKVAKNNQKNIYFEHQLVHNEAVDELLSKYGNYKIYNDETLKSDDIFLISAHGHNYFLDDKLGNPQIESAFCSLLQNRFIVIKKAVEKRKKIYYLGEINHPESISTISYIEKKLSYKVQILKDKDDFFCIARNNFLTPTLLIVQSTYKEQIEFNDKNLQIIGACPFVYKRLELIKTMKDFNGHISTGLVGIQQLMRGLSDYGRTDLAYRIATNRTYPSWGYMVDNGATTIWELWNGNTADPAMNSANHVMLLGDLIVWAYGYLGGISNAPGNVGFKQIQLKPYPVDGLDFVNTSFHSIYGEVRSHWKKEDGSFCWDISVPCNTSALVYVPVADKSIDPKEKKRIVGEGGTFLRMEGSYAVFSFPSGSYQLKTRL